MVKARNISTQSRNTRLNNHVYELIMAFKCRIRDVLLQAASSRGTVSLWRTSTIAAMLLGALAAYGDETGTDGGALGSDANETASPCAFDDCSTLNGDGTPSAARMRISPWAG